MLQQRQCRDKLRALRQVRERMRFYPLAKRREGDAYSMHISNRMILSRESDGCSKSARHSVGIDALGGLEMLLFAFFSRPELVRVSEVCRAWRALARHDLFWEPLLVTPLEKYPLRPLLGLERDPTRRDDVPAILVYMVYQRLKLAQAPSVACNDGNSTATNAATNAATRYNGRFLQLFQTLNRQGQNVVGAADDEDVFSVADGHEKVTLGAWLSTKKRISERTLRSFFRQILLAVDALERSNCEHADISLVNIVVLQDYRHHSRRRTPFFQLFFSRRNCQYTVNADAVPPAGNGGNGGNGILAAAFRNRIALPHPSMVSSVLQTAMTLWARGRFVDANSPTVLALLLRFPGSFSSALRSFLEYAKYLIITHSATASKLLRHEYLQYPGAQLARLPSAHWFTIPINDVNEYKSKLVAYYGSLPSRVMGLLDDNSSSCISSTVTDELMPRTNFGFQYFSRALEEVNLPGERFVSIVAPSIVTSSWVRELARTQTSTLQRLDLSNVRVPTSVLLQELATLPRVTHLRLPRQVLRDENLEHLVAELAYTDLLPQLQGLDDNVRQAMDRMEKSYLMQLDMFTFLLQKPSASSPTAGDHNGV
ncbi:F-box protein [Phytophthora megakarya]|uniref:F-box protein n=1 Tax=Phytophthora megakarya TaxID=4795 RepID=A0A225WNW8_9STRA|nr:F-box protein [Phytophthora megakarya]